MPMICGYATVLKKFFPSLRQNISYVSSKVTGTQKTSHR